MAVEILRPNASGDETNISYQTPSSGSHWDKVNEIEADTGTYVYMKGTSYQRDLYNLPPSSGSGTINFIEVYFRGMCQLSNYAFIKPSLRSNSTITEGTEVTLSGNWVTYSQQWDTNPADSVAWQWTDIEALQIGILLKSQYYGYYARCTQVYVEVDYTEAVGAYYHGLKVQGVGELALCDVGTHSLRMRKGGTTYGVELVATDDPNASAIRIKTGVGIKAIRKYT